MSRSADSRPASDRRVFRRVHKYRGGDGIDMSVWPATVPAVAQLIDAGLDLTAGITVLIGENGSGKSTVVEVRTQAAGRRASMNSVMGRDFSRSCAPGSTRPGST